MILIGNVDTDLNFEYGENTNVYGGCGATLMGEMWYFGGDRNVVFFIISNKYKSFFRWVKSKAANWFDKEN